jgi:biotin-dependent carboxylase-like uncharacterized protein
MDPLALQAGNLMVGNPATAAGIEISSPPFSVRFETATRFALVGGDFYAQLDGRAYPPWWTTLAEPGQVLRVLRGKRGGKGFLCVAGGVNVLPVLGSRSTDIKGGFGGLEGRRLMKGDTLPLGQIENVMSGSYGVRPPKDRMNAQQQTCVRVIPAAEFSLLTEQSREDFLKANWTVSPNSNRMGYRLVGPALNLTQKLELRSYGITPGIIQLPPAGQPIIQLSEANTLGGYPRVGVIIQSDLRHLAQAPVGSWIQFEICDVSQALSASINDRQWLETTQQQIGWYRSS